MTPGSCTVKISGALTFDTIESQRIDAEQSIRQAHAAITFDLSYVEVIDSSALSFCLCCYRLGQTLDKQVTFEHIPKQMVAMSNLFGLTLFSATS